MVKESKRLMVGSLFLLILVAAATMAQGVTTGIVSNPQKPVVGEMVTISISPQPGSECRWYIDGILQNNNHWQCRFIFEKEGLHWIKVEVVTGGAVRPFVEGIQVALSISSATNLPFADNPALWETAKWIIECFRQQPTDQEPPDFKTGVQRVGHGLIATVLFMIAYAILTST